MNKKQEYRNIINNLKINGCAICGYNKNNTYLDFHHTNKNDKIFKISNLNNHNKSNVDIANELNKCILLCKRCHGLFGNEWQLS